MATTLITEHPTWHTAPEGTAVRVVEHAGVAWVAQWIKGSLLLSPEGGAPVAEVPALSVNPAAQSVAVSVNPAAESAALPVHPASESAAVPANPAATPQVTHPMAPPVANAVPQDLPTAPEAQPLTQELGRLGVVQRLTNPSLWDAIATALLRQVVRAEQARRIHRAFYRAYGRPIETPAGHDPEALLAYAHVDLARDRDHEDDAVRRRDEFSFSVGIQFGEVPPEQLRAVLADLARRQRERTGEGMAA